MTDLIRSHAMMRIFLFVGAGLLLAACAGGGPEAGDPTTTTAPSPGSTMPATTTAPSPTTTATTTTTSTPTTTTTTATLPPLDGTLTVAGPEEIVFDWTTDRCEDLDIPDLPARAFRSDQGDVNLISTHIVNRRFFGDNFDELERICDPIFESTQDPDPAQFTDSEWVASVYTEDGIKVNGLIHNEYHGWERGDCAGSSTFNCWYNSITSVVSTDGGKTFQYAQTPPGHLVASLPYQYEADTAAVGLFSPSNIVRNDADGFFYALAKVGANRTGRQTVCLMRTDDLDDPSSWRFWDGKRFDGVFVDPYTTVPENPRENECPALALNEIGAQMIESLTWNTALQQWLLVGISADTIDGREIWGFYYSWSNNLIDWTKRKLLIEIALPWTVG
ncbi:MAG: hypothetical protein M3132_13565, partial [Actinomycetia bacterium]|nr:hypothetical protein [Actinomycetes bacterium]